MKKGQRRYKSWSREGFPRWLQDCMESRGWSASDMAREVGVTPSLVSRWMTGRQQLSHESLTALARALNLPLTEVLMAAGYLTPEGVPDDPRRLELIEKIKSIDLTHERYLTLNSLLTAMAQVTSPAVRRETSEAPLGGGGSPRDAAEGKACLLAPLGH